MQILRRLFIFAVVSSGVFLFSSHALAATVGDQQSFFVDPTFDSQSRTSLAATLKVVSTQAAVWVEDAYFNGLSQSDKNTFLSTINNLASEFDATIYPRLKQTFGPPWEPGIDNDMHIVILFMQLKSGFSGYTNTGDEIPRSQFPTSNEHEMVYINARSFNNFVQLRAVLAHEFVHVITFYLKQKLYNVEEDVWLNEARAEYAPTLLGYNSSYSGSYLQSRVQSFKAGPDDALGEWKNQSADYGIANMFVHYLVDRFGVDVLQRSFTSRKAGIASLDEALAGETGAPTFAQVFRSFMGAVWVNNALAGQEYAFTNPDLSAANLKIITPTASYGVPSAGVVNSSQQAKDWAVQWLKFSGGGENKTLEVVLQFDVPATVVAITASQNGAESVPFVFNPSTVITVRIPNFGTSVAMVTLGVALGGKTTDFTANDPTHSYLFTAQAVQSAPFSISQITPGNIIAFGGAAVAVAGTNFIQGMTLTIDDQNVPLTFESATRMSFVAPSLASGPKCLVFTHPSGGQIQDCSSVTYVSYAQGSLIRASNDYRVYIVKDRFIRHIVSPEIFNFYGHLGFAVVQVVAPEVVTQFKPSAWIRADGDPMVYEANDDGTKHWMHMTAEQFVTSRRSWEGVYLINSGERDWYRAGADVLYQ